MPAMELLCKMIGTSSQQLSQEEQIVLEAELFTRLCEELKQIFKSQYKDYFRLMKVDKKMEEVMLEEKFARCVINDILSTEEYTLPGIAYYTQMPEDVVYDIAMGRNTDPSSTLFRKLIKLHQSVRPALYKELMKKMLASFLAEENK